MKFYYPAIRGVIKKWLFTDFCFATPACPLPPIPHLILEKVRLSKGLKSPAVLETTERALFLICVNINLERKYKNIGFLTVIGGREKFFSSYYSIISRSSAYL